MAVFRVEKNKGYTVMSNHHLRNTDLSLKAKGLLSQMLSLPEDWDYTLQGLAHINKEKIDAIRTAVWELEAAGYIERTQLRDEQGKMSNTLYTIYEQPQEKAESVEKPELSPLLDFPISDNPTPENPTTENPTQLNKEVIKTDLQNKELKKDLSYPILSSFPQAAAPDGIDKDMDRGFLDYEKIISENIRYDLLMERYPKERDLLREMYGLILEAVGSGKKQIRIAGGIYSPEFVRQRLLRLTDSHLLYVLDCLNENTTKIRNIKQYLLAALFNAPITIESYYTTLVSHDLAHGVV